MRQLIPHFIVRQYDAGVYNGRFPAATLVLDISGFTAITEAIVQRGWQNTEILADVMQRLFDLLIQQVYNHGGFIANFAGDAFTAIFPQTTAVASEWLAVAAAWGCQTALSSAAQQQTPLGEFTFALRLGVGCGDVQWQILRNLGSPDEDQIAAAYFFGGQGVEDCLAAIRQAMPGELLLSPTLYARLAARLVVTPKDHFFQLQQLDHPLPAPQPFDVTAHLLDESAFIPAALQHVHGRGEFRQVVTLFILVQHEADLAALIQHIFQWQRRYGGYLNTVQASDKGYNLLLFWGMPRSRENDVERALAFALALAATGFTFRAGLTYQPMYAGFVGGSWRQEYSVYGRGVNLASRLMTQASWGEIWLDERLHQAAPASFARRALGVFTFKGFQQPQPAYQLLGQQQAGATTHARQLVGRQAELKGMIRFIQPLSNGRFAGNLTIYGEVGMGKSRLLQAFLQSWPVTLHHQYLLGENDETNYEPLSPFRRALRRHFNQDKRLPETENWRRFETACQELLAATADPVLHAALEQATPFLAALVAPHWGGALAPDLTPQWRWQNSFAALKNFCKAESLRRPLLICLEDVHWLDEESRAFLVYLSHNLYAYPIALIATARPQTAPLFTQRERDFPTPTINLDSLTLADLYLLADYLLDGPVDMPLARLLMERSAGNPLFAGQILLYLRDLEHLVHDKQGRWRLRGQPAAALPADAQAIFTARLDGLPPEARQLTQTAAVLGQEFDLAVLSQMEPTAASATPWLTQLETWAIWTMLPNGRYRFNHVLLREAAYEMQLLARRRRLHLAAATALETVHHAALPDYAADLAYHYEMAGQPETAVSWYQRAAEQSVAQYANNSALHYLNRALSLTPADTVATQYALHLAREHIYDWLGARSEQTAELSLLASLSEQLDITAMTAVSLRRVNYAIAVGEKETAVTLAHQAVGLAQHSGQLEQQAYAHRRLGQVLWGLHQYEDAQRNLQQALHLAQTANLPQLIADCLNGLGMVLDDQGAYDAAYSHYQDALRQQQQHGDLAGQITTRNNLGWLAFFQGYLTEAQAEYEQSLAICQQVGHKMGESSLLNNVGVIAFMYGDLAQAEYIYQQGLELCREIGNRGGEANTAANLALLKHCQERPSEAEAFALEAIHISRRWDFPLTLAEALTYLGHIRWAEGGRETAVVLYQEAITIYETVGQERRAIEARAARARLMAERGAIPDAQREINKIWPQLRENQLEGVLNPYDVYLNAYWVCQAAGNACGPTILNYAYERLQAQAAKIQSEAMQQMFLQRHTAQRQLLALWRAMPTSLQKRLLPDNAAKRKAEARRKKAE
ncbi:MAG: tetratricopeptide repeat protein [Anaerolinea sp.]|nr:tetratricopeptide repeat protein [Anaerolinea sp.]